MESNIWLSNFSTHWFFKVRKNLTLYGLESYAELLPICYYWGHRSVNTSNIINLLLRLSCFVFLLRSELYGIGLGYEL